MKTVKATAIYATFFLAVLNAVPVFAGPYSDDMAKCLVKSTSNADRSALVKWMFSAAALHPEVKSIASVTESERNELNKKTAKLFERLLTESCRTETQQAVKFEGSATIQASFQILGQVAGRELFSEPHVADSMAGLQKYLDKQKLERLFGSEQNTK